MRECEAVLVGLTLSVSVEVTLPWHLCVSAAVDETAAVSLVPAFELVFASLHMSAASVHLAVSVHVTVILLEFLPVFGRPQPAVSASVPNRLGLNVSSC